jgi:diguanylate cyclase (GGDEF)-like protein
MRAEVANRQNPDVMRVARPTSWKLALIVGFVTQLLLILFVTLIGLRQLDITTRNLDTVVDVHMHKQNLTKAMVVTARQRTMIIFMLPKTEDAFERDELLMQFRQFGSDFVAARLALLEMPLNGRERELIDLQRERINVAQPFQEHIIDLIMNDSDHDAIELLLKKAIPAQNSVQAVMSQLDAEIQRNAMAASRMARDAHRVARQWMYLLSSLALLVSAAVAALVLRFASRVSHEREQLATHDTLTGLPNRLLFKDRLEQALMRAQRRGTLVGVMFIDLDRFKRINDTLGHDSGDQLISEMARRLSAVARAEDTVARLGGDEFVVIASDAATVGHILQIVEKMRAAMASPYQIAGRELFCSSSIGISIYPNDGTDSGSLLKNADTAMYHAKNAGRDRFQLYDVTMNAMAEERLQLETDLHYALERNEFVFHYQPQINLDSGHIQCVEALIRWNHPEKGLLAPDAFLGILEETGEIVSVGRTLLATACSQTASWHAAGFTRLDIAVNLSSKEFWHTSLIANVRDALKESGLPPQSLHLELTEGIFMEDVDSAIERIKALKMLGVGVAIDDFGTGYSSLAHLKRFPIDTLKIDRYFVRDLPKSLANKALISSILALCQGLHLGTVAEGVETREQLESLRKLGCKTLQGYFISRPVPAEKIVALLDRNWLKEFDAA